MYITKFVLFMVLVTLWAQIPVECEVISSVVCDACAAGSQKVNGLCYKAVTDPLYTVDGTLLNTTSFKKVATALLAVSSESCLKCPDATWTLKGMLCYKYLGATKKTHDAAKVQCTGLGAKLPMPKTQEQHDAVVAVRNANGGTSDNFVWIGLNDKAVEGTFKWEDAAGTTLVKTTQFNMWRGVEPNNSGGNEDCTHIWANGNTWNDINCNTPQAVVCQKAPGVPTTTTTTAAPHCGNIWGPVYCDQQKGNCHKTHVKGVCPKTCGVCS